MSLRRANPYPHGRITSRAYWNKWDRCVKKVKARCRATGSCPQNAYAVCHKAIQRTTRTHPLPNPVSKADPWVALGVTVLGVAAFVALIKALGSKPAQAQ